MIEQVVRLIFPPALLNTPVINHLMRSYTDLAINILRANVTNSEGWLEVQFVGTQGLIEDAIGWLQQKGVEVHTLGA